MFEKFREALESVLDAAARPDHRDALRAMHDAVIEAKTSLRMMEDGLGKTQKALDHEKKQLDDAVRRGDLARKIDDTETVEIAETYTVKHRERVDVLERKLTAQREELVLAHRELQDMKTKLQTARNQIPQAASDRIESAWREIESAGGTRPGLGLEDEILEATFSQAQKEAAAQAKLDQLKKKMGR